MKVKIKESLLFWPAKRKNGSIFVLDETLIPSKIKYIQVNSAKEAVSVIRQMKTRAFGQLLVVFYTFDMELSNVDDSNDKKLFDRIRKIADMLNKSRPTFPFSEVTSMVVGIAAKCLAENINVARGVRGFIKKYLVGIKQRRIDRVRGIAKIIKNKEGVLTHCNVSGELAMAAYICKQKGQQNRFFVTETRPYLQGAKLSCWELKRMGANVTLIADNAIGAVMTNKLVQKVIVGSDRSCANGDFANKIGTYQIAVLAAAFKIPFFVLTQPSKKVKSGNDIPIEIRNEKELLYYEGKKIITGSVRGFYPGFDVVPHNLVTKEIPIDVR